MTRKRKRPPLAEPDRHPTPNPSKSGCRCRNHLGGPKQQHRSRAAAVTHAARSAHHGGTWTIYQCPTSDRWHVTSKQQRPAK